MDPHTDPVRSEMKTLFLSQYFTPEPHETYGRRLAEWLAAHGHEIEVLTGIPNYPGGRVYDGYRIRWRQRQTIGALPVVRVPLYPSHDYTVRGRVLNYGSFALAAATVGTASVRPADVAFVYHPPATIGLAALALKQFRSIPFVFHVSDMWPESLVETGRLGEGRLRRVVERTVGAWCSLVYRHAAAVTVLSPGFKELLVSRGVPADKIHVVYNWADEVLFRPVGRDEELAERLGLSGRFNVVYSGNVGVFQGIESLVDAASLLDDLPDVQLVVVGGGAHAGEIKQYAERTRARNVRFVDRQPAHVMPAINALSDVMAIHLQDREFFRSTIPGKTQVALASGRPVLMGVRGDAADLVKRARAGVCVQPGNPASIAAGIRELHALRADEREEMGRRGRDYYLAHLSLERAGREMDGILRAAAGHARQSGRTRGQIDPLAPNV